MSKTVQDESQPRIGRLQLSRETLRDLAESEAEGAVGGLIVRGSYYPYACPSRGCFSVACNVPSAHKIRTMCVLK